MRLLCNVKSGPSAPIYVSGQSWSTHIPSGGSVQRIDWTKSRGTLSSIRGPAAGVVCVVFAGTLVVWVEVDLHDSVALFWD